MKATRVKRVGALLVGLSLVVAACGSDDEGSATTDATETTDEMVEETTAPDTTDDMTEETTAPDTTDAAAEAECGSAPSTVTDGDLAGFGATTPFGEITPEFIARLCEIDPSLEDLNYATETYDAIMITALAVLQAGTDGIEHAAEINGITRDGEKCTTFADCAALIEAGTDIDYDGVSGPLTFAGNGEPIVASYAKLIIGDNNRVDIESDRVHHCRGPARTRRRADAGRRHPRR